MIAVDANILVYAHREELPQHRRALDVLAALAEGPASWALPVFVLGEFLRVVTHHRMFAPPSTRATAVAAVDALLGSPSVVVLHPGARYWPLLRDALDDADARGNLVLDAEIVAVCREHGVREVLTQDRDFRRFSGLTVRPLDASA